MELSRLRAEPAKAKREDEIFKKQRRTSRKKFCEVRLDRSDAVERCIGVAGGKAKNRGKLKPFSRPGLPDCPGCHFPCDG